MSWALLNYITHVMNIAMKSFKPIRLLTVLWLGISMLLVEIRSPFAQEHGNDELGRIEETKYSQERVDGCLSGDPVIVARTILPDGGIELRNSNGCAWRGSPERERQILLDPAGDEVPLEYPLSSVIAVALPSPPASSSSEAEWMNEHSNKLLKIIVSLVPDDKNAETNYLKSEKSGATIYERIERRTAVIDHLTRR